MFLNQTDYHAMKSSLLPRLLCVDRRRCCFNSCSVSINAFCTRLLPFGLDLTRVSLRSSVNVALTCWSGSRWLLASFNRLAGLSYEDERSSVKVERRVGIWVEETGGWISRKLVILKMRKEVVVSQIWSHSGHDIVLCPEAKLAPHDTRFP